MDKDSLRRVYRSMLEHHLPRGACHDGYGSRFDDPHPPGHLRQLRRHSHCILGISAGELPVGCAKDRIASPEVRHSWTYMLDDASHVGPEYQRQRLVNDASARPDPCVPRTHACRLDAQQDLSVARSRPRHVLRYEGVDVAEAVNADRLHDAPHDNDTRRIRCDQLDDGVTANSTDAETHT